jgi:hypothetical protein
MTKASWEKIRKIKISDKLVVGGKKVAYTVEDMLTGEGGLPPEYDEKKKVLKIQYYDSHMDGRDEDFVLRILSSVASKMSHLFATVEGEDVPFLIFIWKGGQYVKDYVAPDKPSRKEKAIGERRFRVERKFLPPEFQSERSRT